MKKDWRDRLIEIVEWEKDCYEDEIEELDWGVSVRLLSGVLPHEEYNEVFMELCCGLWAIKEIHKIAIDISIEDPIYEIEKFWHRLENYSCNCYETSSMFSAACCAAESILEEWQGGIF